jgi:hypothetical protein
VANGNGCHDPDRAALEMVTTPIGTDRRDGDYSRSVNGHSKVPRLQVGANGHAPPAPPGPCRCDEVSVREVGDRWLCSGCGGVPVPLEVAPW